MQLPMRAPSSAIAATESKKSISGSSGKGIGGGTVSRSESLDHSPTLRGELSRW